MAKDGAQRGVLRVAHLIVFLAFTDNFSMFPTIGPYTRSLGGDPLAMGVMVAAYSVSNLLFNVLGGIMLDRAGRRRLLLVGLAAAAASMAAYAFADNLSALLLVRLLHGAAGGVLVPAVFTMIADLAPTTGRGQAMGRAGALIGSAAVIAPGLAGGLRQGAGFKAVFFAAALLLLIGLAVAFWRLPETRQKPSGMAGAGEDGEGPGSASARVSPGSSTKTDKAAASLTAGGQPAAGGMLAGYWSIFVLTFTMGTLTAFLPDSVESLGYPAGITGLMFTAFGLTAALAMVSPLSQAIDQRGILFPAGSGMVLIAASLALLAAAKSLLLISIACLVFGAGYGLVFPAASGQIALVTGAHGRGRAFGVFYAVFSLGVIVGAPLAGYFTSPTPFFGSSYFTALAAALLGAVGLYGLVKKIQPTAGTLAAPDETTVEAPRQTPQPTAPSSR